MGCPLFASYGYAEDVGIIQSWLDGERHAASDRAALAYPGRQVVALCGDGGISMLLGDLATIVQYHLPIKLIVFNNRSLGMVKLEMEVAGLPDWQTTMLNPDFARVALSMGMAGYNVINPTMYSHFAESV